MQRLIVVIALVFGLLGGAFVFGFWNYRQSRPDRQWIPLPINPEFNMEQLETAIGKLRESLHSDEVLAAIARDCQIREKWKLASDEAAVAELKERAFIEHGQGTIDIGFKGVIGEQQELKDLTVRIMKDFQRLNAPSEDSTPDSPTGP